MVCIDHILKKTQKTQQQINNNYDSLGPPKINQEWSSSGWKGQTSFDNPAH